MSNNIKTYHITPIKPATCCGFDVDASEDGCSIIPCDCKICVHTRTEQLEFLVEEINTIKNPNNVDVQTIKNIQNKISRISNNEKVYTTS